MFVYIRVFKKKEKKYLYYMNNMKYNYVKIMNVIQILIILNYL